ncbi:MAG: hypothetical protein ACK5LP_07560 [Campylobacteraceae bacterium]
MSIKTWFFSSFREVFLYHHRSLEFRAKTYALIMAPLVEDIKEYDFALLRDVANETYVDDKKRQEILVHTVKNYIAVILKGKCTIYDEFIKDILLDVKMRKELTKKVNLEQLKRFFGENLPEDKMLLQKRIYEFFENLSKE